MHSEALVELAKLVAADAPVSTPTPTSTGVPGELRDSIEPAPGVTFSGTRYVGQVVTDKPQGGYTDRGTDPHPIRPRGSGYPLRFYWPKAGGIVHRMSVNHPGSHKHDGWWDRSLRAHYQQALSRAGRRTPF